MLDSKSSEIFQNIRRELELKSPGGGKETAPVEPGAEVDGMSGYGSTEEIALLKAIRFAEGTTDSYGTVFGGKIVQELADGKLTVEEVIDMGNTGRLPARFGGRTVGYGKQSGATGAYQFMPKTLQTLISSGVLKEKDLFTNELQDKAALALAARRGVKSEDLKREGLSSSVAAKLAPEWASFPNLSGGSFYSNQHVRKLSEIQQVYKQSMNETPLNLGGKAVDIAGSVAMVETSQFGTPRPGHLHQGIDIASKRGNSAHLPVVVRVGGRVDYAGIANDGNGIVIIKHSNGDITRYIHLNNFRVREGQNITAGTIIGRIAGPGEKGYGTSEGAHLHFEYKPKGKYAVNPKAVWRNYVTLGGSATPTTHLKIASSPQFSKLQAITNVATGIYSDEEITNTHIIRQTIIT
jgi:lysozyme